MLDGTVTEMPQAAHSPIFAASLPYFSSPICSPPLCNLWAGSEAPLSPGGQLKMFIDEQEEVVYEERPGQLKELTPRLPFVHNITFCSPPIHSKASDDRSNQSLLPWRGASAAQSICQDLFSLFVLSHSPVRCARTASCSGCSCTLSEASTTLSSTTLAG